MFASIAISTQVPQLVQQCSGFCFCPSAHMAQHCHILKISCSRTTQKLATNKTGKGIHKPTNATANHKFLISFLHLKEGSLPLDILHNTHSSHIYLLLPNTLWAVTGIQQIPAILNSRAGTVKRWDLVSIII